MLAWQSVALQGEVLQSDDTEDEDACRCRLLESGGERRRRWNEWLSRNWYTCMQRLQRMVNRWVTQMKVSERIAAGLCVCSAPASLRIQ
jgi:hypothetical protein